MGQKSRNKKNRAGNHSKQNHKQSSGVATTTALPLQEKASILQGNAPVRQRQPTPQNTNVRTSMTEHMEYVRGDIIRIIQLLVIMGLILAGFALLNTKTSVLRNTGEKLSHFMRLQ